MTHRQTAAPAVVNLDEETAATKKLYGIDEKETDEFGRRCLLARRMVERGVRFVQLYSGDTGGWDAHRDVTSNHTTYCRRTDKPIAGLLTDLEQRGLLEDTLVLWGGEFGRTPTVEITNAGKSKLGRDHNSAGFSMVLAGGGVRGGTVYGATDEFGFQAVENPVHVHDLHATILHLMGFDHERLTYRYASRDFRLTDVHGRVIRDIIA